MKGATRVRRSGRSFNRYLLGGFVAGANAAKAPMFDVLAIQATAWTTSHVAKGSTPRPLELPGGSTG